MKSEHVFENQREVRQTAKSTDDDLVKMVITEQEILQKNPMKSNLSYYSYMKSRIEAEKMLQDNLRTFFESKIAQGYSNSTENRVWIEDKSPVIMAPVPSDYVDSNNTVIIREVLDKKIQCKEKNEGETNLNQHPQSTSDTTMEADTNNDEMVCTSSTWGGTKTEFIKRLPPPCVMRNQKRQCRFPGCVRTIKSQGHCQSHGALVKRCKVKDCEKQAQGTHEGMCKRHWKEAHNIPELKRAKAKKSLIPEGDSIYDAIVPASLAWKGTQKKVEGKEMMPLVSYLKSNAHLEVGWHRAKERKSRGLPETSTTSSQLDTWERQLVLLEIALLAGTLGHRCYQDLAHAWGRETGFHNVLCHQVCERRGEIVRKKRSDTGKMFTREQKEKFRAKLNKAQSKTKHKNKKFLESRHQAIAEAKQKSKTFAASQRKGGNKKTKETPHFDKSTRHSHPMTDATFVYPVQPNNAANQALPKESNTTIAEEKIVKYNDEMNEEILNPPVHFEEADIEEMVKLEDEDSVKEHIKIVKTESTVL